jgi:RHS repeat-associated protein
LGSTTQILDESGTVLHTKSYDAFGKPRNGDWSDMTGGLFQAKLDFSDTNGTIDLTKRGFTDHEHLDEMQLIHMNGRMYDYNNGRFLSVDPFIQSPTSTQSLNPYTYIFNNPLSGVDPTGYEVIFDRKKDCQGISEAACNNKIDQLLGRIKPKSNGNDSTGSVHLLILSFSTDELEAADCESDECGYRNDLRTKGRGWLAVVIDQKGNVKYIEFTANDNFFEKVVAPIIDKGLKEAAPGGGALDCATRDCNTLEKGLAAIDFIPVIGKVIAKAGGIILVPLIKHIDEADDVFEIIDGVRRSKAADLQGKTHIAAEILDGNVVVDVRNVKINSLLSPNKSTIDMSTNVNTKRFLDVMEGTKTGSVPPIQVRKGTKGVKVKDINLDSTGQGQ